MVRPAGLGPRTRSPAKTTRMRRLCFDFPIPGCWADLQKHKQACAGLSGPRARRCRAQTFAPCRPCASARAPLSSCTKGRHPHGPRQHPAGSGPAGRTRTWSRQGRATRNVGNAQERSLLESEWRILQCSEAREMAEVLGMQASLGTALFAGSSECRRPSDVQPTSIPRRRRTPSGFSSKIMSSSLISACRRSSRIPERRFRSSLLHMVSLRVRVSSTSSARRLSFLLGHKKYSETVCTAAVSPSIHGHGRVDAV